MRFLVVIPALLFALGSYKGFQLGAPDFNVFYFASHLVREGRYADLYTVSPDRFLYVPGFAWLLYPFALLPFTAAFVLWSILKASLFGAMLKVLYRRAGVPATVLATLFFARPLLIDLRYGQINLAILSLAVLALDVLCAPASNKRSFWSWFSFSLAATAKLFPITIAIATIRSRISRFGAAVAVFLIGVLPVLGVGFSGLWEIYISWFGGLQSKGLPIDTHNQSLLAFLLRVFSNVPSPSLQLGGQIRTHGFNLFSQDVSLLFGKAVILALLMVLLFVAYRVSKNPTFEKSALLVSLVILPSHLIWKPYFIFSIPLIATAFSKMLVKGKKPYGFWALIALGIFLSLSSHEFVGREAAAALEAWSSFYWIDIIAILISVRVLAQPPQLFDRRA